MYGFDIGRAKDIVELASGAARDIVSIVRGEPTPTWVQKTGETVISKTLDWTPIVLAGAALYLLSRKRKR